MNSMKLAEKILVTISRYQRRHHAEPLGPIRLSLADARALDEESRRSGDLVPQSTIQIGDTGTLWGRKFVVSGRLTPGIAYLGRTRITL